VKKKKNRRENARKKVVFSRRQKHQRASNTLGRRIRTTDLSFFEKTGRRSFLSARRRGVWEKSARGSRKEPTPQTNISRDIPLISERRIAGRTLYKEEEEEDDDERRGRRTQKRRRSAAPRGGSESAKRIHDHENQRKLDGRGTPTVRRGHRAVRRPRGFGFFFLFFFFFSLVEFVSFFVPADEEETILRCSADKRESVFCLNRTIRRARANVDKLYRYFFLSHFVSPSSTRLLFAMKQIPAKLEAN